MNRQYHIRDVVATRWLQMLEDEVAVERGQLNMGPSPARCEDAWEIADVGHRNRKFPCPLSWGTFHSGEVIAPLQLPGKADIKKWYLHSNGAAKTDAGGLLGKNVAALIYYLISEIWEVSIKRNVQEKMLSFIHSFTYSLKHYWELNLCLVPGKALITPRDTGLVHC